jgi:xanthine/CO dehydrogenase XdhC/CoxF family maturation factor
MREIADIVNAVSDLADGERAMLATVIDVKGSGYRLPGARMLILAGGETIGTVSGGCLEADVLERAKKISSSGRAEIFTYDTTRDDNSPFGLNMGCRGVIRILLEPVDRHSPLIDEFRHVAERRENCSVATLLDHDGEGANIGGRSFSGGRPGDLSPAIANSAAFREAFSCFIETDTSWQVRSVEVPGGIAEFAFEKLQPPVMLLLFGAGADAGPLAALAAEVGWQYVVHDHRPAFLTPARFPLSKKLSLSDPDLAPALNDADVRTAAVMMTHSYPRDRLVLPALLRSKAFYVGALGPKRRTAQLLEEAAADGYEFTDEQLDRLFAPAGLDIGADTPEGIALSIVCEIQAVLAGRDGGQLRRRQGSIYDRESR